MWPCLFIPGVLIDEYMAAHGELNNGHPLVFQGADAGVLNVQPHDLGVSSREPRHVHVEDPLQFCWIVGVDRLDLLIAVDGDIVHLREVVDGVHGDAAGEKKRLEWNCGSGEDETKQVVKTEGKTEERWG